MEITLTPDQQAFVRQAIASGRIHGEEEAVKEALALWEERERQRLEFLDSLDRAEAALARGEGRPVTPDSLHALIAEIKERGRQRLSAELAARR